MEENVNKKKTHYIKTVKPAKRQPELSETNCLYLTVASQSFTSCLFYLKYFTPTLSSVFAAEDLKNFTSCSRRKLRRILKVKVQKIQSGFVLNIKLY